MISQIDYKHKAFEIDHFHTFWTSVTLTWVIQHTVVYHSSTYLYLQIKFHSNQKHFYGWTDGH